MRLPGTRYQEPGWEQVRKLLGQCSLDVFSRCDPGELLAPVPLDEALGQYVDLLAGSLHAASRSARAQAPGNSYGDSVVELALLLACELAARPGDFEAFRAALTGERGVWRLAGGEALLRKKVNDMFALLRDKVDADNYQVACGRPCSPNRIYAYRMLDTAYGEISRLFAGWREHRAQVGAILGRPLETALPTVLPIEVRQLASIAGCRPEWILRWSETLARFTGSPGPLHTRSKRFDSLKGNADKIKEMLLEIGEYEALSANRDRDWLQDADTSAAWLEDYWRVLDESSAAGTPGPDLILEALQDEIGIADAPEPAFAAGEEDPVAVLRAQSVSLPPGFVLAAGAAQEPGSWSARMLSGESLAVRLAVYAKLLGPEDDSYPDAWRDPATGLLPAMAQLAALDAVSLPTLRKRRDAAIARLEAATSNGRSE